MITSLPYVTRWRQTINYHEARCSGIGSDILNANSTCVESAGPIENSVLHIRLVTKRDRATARPPESRRDYTGRGPDYSGRGTWYPLCKFRGCVRACVRNVKDLRSGKRYCAIRLKLMKKKSIKKRERLKPSANAIMPRNLLAIPTSR